MKPRTPEARLLEEEYFVQLRAALANRPADDAGEIIESLRQHLEDAAADLAEPEIAVAQMQLLLNRLGAPEAIAAQQAALAPTSLQALPPIPPPAANDLSVLGPMISEAVDIYRKNFLMLLLASILYNILVPLTLLILGGPLTAGFFYMTLATLRRPDRRSDLGDLFSQFRRFLPLVGLFFLQAICLLAGTMACLIPGLLLAAIWLFSEPIFVDQGFGVIDSLKASYRLARENFLLCLIVAVLSLVTNIALGSVPYAGIIFQWIATPLFFLLPTLTYIHLRKEKRVPVAVGFPATTPAGSAATSGAQ